MFRAIVAACCTAGARASTNLTGPPPVTPAPVANTSAPASPTTACAAGQELPCLVHQGHCSEGWLGPKHTKNFTSLTACYQYCVGTPECGYISYDALSQRCSTYSPWQRCPSDGKYTNFYSFQVRAPAAVNFTFSAIHSGHCNSAWIDSQNQGNLASVDTCAAWCAGHPICRFFVFSPTGDCSLYAAYGRCGDDGKYPLSTAYAVLRDGEQNWGAVAFKPYFFVSDGHCSSHQATAALKSNGLGECVKACYSQKGGCSFFSYNLALLHCYTFDKCDTTSTSNTTQGDFPQADQYYPGYVSYKIVQNPTV